MSQFLFTLISILANAAASDICTSRASLILVDEFYLKQEYNSDMVELDLSNYADEFQSIGEDSVKFASIAATYDTEAELDEKEPSTLTPLNTDFNLIPVNTTYQSYMADCSGLKAKALEAIPSLYPLLTKAMKTIGFTSTPVRTFMDRLGSLSNSFGDLLKTNARPTDAEITKMQDYYVTLSDEGVLSYPSDSLTGTSKLTGLCMKNNNIWDRKGPSRQKWLTTLSKILPLVSQTKAWGSIFQSVINQLPSQMSLYKKIGDKLTLNTPLSLTRIKNFYKNFNDAIKWESSTVSDFNKFLEFIKDFQDMSRLFKRQSPPTTTTTLRPLASIQPPVTIEPLFSIAQLDRDRLQRFIDVDPTKINITGPVETIPLFKHEEPNKITARTSFYQYSETDKIRIYHVKPIIYGKVITTITHVIATNKNYLASLSTPTPFGCVNDITTSTIRICQGYTTPGLSILRPEDSIDCGNSLAIDDLEADFSRCPSKPAPKFPVAYRVNCKGSQAVITSTKPIIIRVYCDNTSKRPLKLDTFPTYLNTRCEIRLLDDRTEIALLPQLMAKFAQDQILDVIPVTFATSSSLTVSTTSSPVVSNTSAVLSSAVNPALMQSNSWVEPTIISMCALAFGTLTVITCYFCCKTTFARAIRTRCTPSCCSPGSSGTQDAICSCCCKRAKPPKPPLPEVNELMEQILKYPHFLQERELQDRPEIKPLMTDNNTLSRPMPASAPAEEAEVENITMQRELSKSSKSINTIAEIRNLLQQQQK